MTIRLRFPTTTTQGPSRAPGENHPPETCGHQHDDPPTTQSIAPTHTLEHNHEKLQYHQNSTRPGGDAGGQDAQPEETTDFCRKRPLNNEDDKKNDTKCDYNEIPRHHTPKGRASKRRLTRARTQHTTVRRLDPPRHKDHPERQRTKTPPRYMTTHTTTHR